jgi:hypothetical protein
MRADVMEAANQGEAAAVPSQGVPIGIDEADDALPLGRLAGLLGSGAFAFTASLTCFVC